MNLLRVPRYLASHLNSVHLHWPTLLNLFCAPPLLNLLFQVAHAIHSIEGFILHPLALLNLLHPHPSRRSSACLFLSSFYQHCPRLLSISSSFLIGH